MHLLRPARYQHGIFEIKWWFFTHNAFVKRVRTNSQNIKVKLAGFTFFESVFRPLICQYFEQRIAHGLPFRSVRKRKRDHLSACRSDNFIVVFRELVHTLSTYTKLQVAFALISNFSPILVFFQHLDALKLSCFHSCFWSDLKKDLRNNKKLNFGQKIVILTKNWKFDRASPKNQEFSKLP